MAEELLDVVKVNAAANNAKRVISVKLKIISLSLITPEAISLSFKAVSKGTIAEDAALIIERLPVVVRCRGCGLEAAVNIPEDAINKIKDMEGHEHEHLEPHFFNCSTSLLSNGGIKGGLEDVFNCNNCSSKDFDIINSDEICLEKVELDV
jgi:hydrogenase nickel incorporation protein HypA/HybF